METVPRCLHFSPLPLTVSRLAIYVNAVLIALLTGDVLEFIWAIDLNFLMLSYHIYIYIYSTYSK